ncbi:MAG: thymidine phosphorylase [Candidatus Aquicultorales bacterium]
MNIIDIIAKKRDGGELSAEEFFELIEDYVHGEIPDYQMSAFLMAAYIRGLNERETLYLARSMVDTGERLDLSEISGVKVDKHSTGGVGDKVSLVVVPLVAAAGCKVAKMTGPSLAHTGGTMDKLDSIPGFRTELGKEEFIEQVRNIGVAITGQTGELTPADKLIYGLRDATGTVSSPPLIASSIVSKKIAGGGDAIVYDVKVGSGAFLKTIAEARDLAATLVTLTVRFGKKASAVISDMNQPLGEAVGNALEVEEAIDMLKGRGPADLSELCFEVASRMLTMGGIAASREEAIDIVEKTIVSGKAIEKFAELVEAQGGDVRIIDSPREYLPHAAYVDDYTAAGEGYIARIDAEAIGRAVIELGAGRREKDEQIDHAVGLILLRKIGDRVDAGDPIAQLHANDTHELIAVTETLDSAISYSDKPVESGPIVLETFELKE